jgi:hypothetical protein
MDPLVTVALVGTAQSGAIETMTDAAPDALVAETPADESSGSNERRLLFQAGVRAIYQSAGYTAPAIDAPAPAETEAWPVASPRVTALVKLLLSGNNEDLQTLAFERMRQAKLLLAPELLPTALSVRDQEKRRLLYPLLGKRGLWLSQFNQSWSWARETLDTPEGALPADAETLWQEGSSGQRIEVLRRLRASNPALARQWIEEAWKREKFEFRVDMTRALAINAGPDDEALLERALDDKAGGVRSAAAEVLRSMPGSALMQRMIARADAMLSYSKGALKVNPPTTIDATWERDGFTSSKSPSVGARASWLYQTLSCVPPVHWGQQLGMSPEQLIAAAAETKWGAELLQGWTKATAQFGAPDWVMPLWNRWLQPAKKGDSQTAASEMYGLLAPQIAASEREAVALRLVADPTAAIGPRFYTVVASLEPPWSQQFGDAYLRGLRAFIAGLAAKTTSADPWDDTLAIAALALPQSCFAAALEPLTLPEKATNWYMQQFQRQLDEFTNTIQLRKRIYEEIPA